MNIPPRRIRKQRRNRDQFLLQKDLKETLDKFLRDTHKVLKWPDIDGLFHESDEGLFDLLSDDTDLNTIDMDALIKVFLEDTATTIMFEYARMASRPISDRARLIVEYIMGPELQTNLEMKPVPLGRLNARVQWVAQDLYSDPNKSPDFFWNLNQFLIPLYYLEYPEDELDKDSDGWGRYLSTTCTLEKAIDVFKGSQNTKMETNGMAIWTVFSVIYAWLTPDVIQRRYLVDWDDGERQLKARLKEILDSGKALDSQVTRVVSSRLFDNHSIFRAPPKASEVQSDIEQRSSTFGSGPDLSEEGPEVLEPPKPKYRGNFSQDILQPPDSPRTMSTPSNPEVRGASFRDVLRPPWFERPMPMPPRAKARGLTFGQVTEKPQLPSIHSILGGNLAIADGSGSGSSGEETPIPEPFRYESPHKTSIPRSDLLETFGPRQKRLKTINGDEKTPKINIVLAKPRESQSPQNSSPQVTTGSNYGHSSMDQLPSKATATLAEEEKASKAENEKAGKAKVEKEKAEKVKRGKSPRRWTEEECEICECIIYAHQDTAPSPCGGYLCPSCQRDKHLVNCSSCDNLFTSTPYTHLDQDDQYLCFKCWKKGPQTPSGKIMGDLSTHQPIPCLIDPKLDLERPHNQPRPTQSQTKAGHQDREDLVDSDAETHKEKSHPSAKGENSVSMDLEDNDGNPGTSLKSKQSERINVSADNMIASTMRDYKKFGL